MTDQSRKFIVYQASAGSGKTYTLVLEYLKIVCLNPDKFRRILAVTFTNKAALEMKTRILEYLSLLASSPKAEAVEYSKYKGLIDTICEATNLSEQLVCERAQVVLTKILHAYTEFAVSTIDSFVQRIIRTFAFDLRIPQNFEVELDVKKILGQGVDLLLSKAGTDDEISEILVNYIRRKLSDGKSWDIENDLKLFATELTKEDAGKYLKEIENLSLSDFKKIIAKSYQLSNLKEAKAVECSKKIVQLFNSNGLTKNSFFQGDRGIYGFFFKVMTQGFDLKNISSYCYASVNEGKWFPAKSAASEQQTIDTLKEQIIEAFHEIEILFKQHKDIAVINKNIFQLSLLNLIHKEVEAIKEESELIFIQDFYSRIHDQIIKEPVPFIYQRIGERFENLFIDEFQDTSVLQFQNMLPLIDNALASGHLNLMVGDGKQAIYRWRNGEVRQFAELPKIYSKSEEIDWTETENSLIRNYQNYYEYNAKATSVNYRSKSEIVNFNNQLFEFLVSASNASETIQSIYKDLKQMPKAGNDGGYVEATFIPDDENYKENQLAKVLETLQLLINQGEALKNIAVICRTNKEAVLIASTLILENIQVISSESLLLNSSEKVNVIISFISLLVQADDEVAQAFLMKFLNRKFFPEVPLHDFFESYHKRNRDADTWTSILKYLNDKGFELSGKELRAMNLYDLSEEILRVFHLHQDSDPFIISYLETVNEFLGKNPSDLSAFLEWYRETGSEKSVSIPEGVDAVKVLTIHKSKGMEFPVVIYPFADENAASKNVFRWVKPQDNEFNELPVMMISVGKSLMETSYESSFTDESDKALLDMINLSYVALTRAENALFVISRKMKSDATLSFNNLLWKYLIQQQPELESALIARFGELKIHYKTQTTDSSIALSNMISGDWKNRIILKPGSERLWDSEQNKKTEWGNLVHLVLSAMIIEDDLPKVLTRFVFEGLLDENLSAEIREYIENMLKDKSIQFFFRPGIHVLNESEILTTEGHIYRPDRIIIEENKNIIIDYKTGKPLEEHKTQVKTYAGLLTEINKNPSSGYLIYLDNPVSLIEV